jgi:DNA-binding response OmpR family regulator
MARILVVEDEPDIAFGLSQDLGLEGYEVEVVGDGPSALECTANRTFDLILLDVMLPGKDCFDVCRELRRTGSQTPIILLTAKSHEAEKVLGLELGADDYVTKPFGLLELMARVDALLRRASADVDEAAAPAIIRFGAVEVDLRSRSVSRAGVRVELAPKEFELLRALHCGAGAVLSRRDLLNQVWGYSAEVHSRTVDTHIAELRRKLEDDPAAPRHILTVRKAGYRLQS